MTLIGGLISAAMIILSFFLGKGKNNAEIDKLRAETDLMEVELADKRFKSFKDQIEYLEKLIIDLKTEVSSMKDQIDSLTRNQCLGNACPTKMAYDKVLAQKENRREKRKVKLEAKNSNK